MERGVSHRGRGWQLKPRSVWSYVAQGNAQQLTLLSAPLWAPVGAVTALSWDSAWLCLHPTATEAFSLLCLCPLACPAPTGGSGEGAKPGSCDVPAFIPSFLPLALYRCASPSMKPRQR